jgi:hypothetical protein
LWSDVNNWAPAFGVPNCGWCEVVFLQGSATVDMSVTVRELSLYNGAQVLVNSGRTLSVYPDWPGLPAIYDHVINLNDGSTLTLGVGGGVGGGATLRLNDNANGPSTTWVTGSGTITMSNEIGNAIIADNPQSSLQNMITIQGSGAIGQGTLELYNSGTIIANQSVPLYIQPSAWGAVNGIGGQMIADGSGSPGATLYLYQGSFDNSGGVIRAINTGTVWISASTISGGGLLADASSQIVASENSAIRDTTIAGRLGVPGGDTLRVSGTIQNTGQLTLEYSGASLRLDNGDTVLTGGGTVWMQGPNSTIVSDNGTWHLENDDNLIHGEGNIGNGTMGLVNWGTITSDVGTLYIQPSSSGVVNEGVLRADGAILPGTTLVLEDGSFQNRGGTIEAVNSGVVQLSNSVVTGGKLSTSTGGTIQAVNNSVIANLTNQGLLEVPDGQELRAYGTIVNSGTLELNSGSAFSTLKLYSGDLVLTGGGSLELSGTGHNIIVSDAYTDWHLVNEADHVIRGSGNILVGTINRGVIVADQPAVPLNIAPSSWGVSNEGVLRADGAVLALYNGNFNNAPGGVIEAVNGGVVDLAQANVTGGTLSTSTGGSVQVIDNSAIADLTTNGQLEVLSGHHLALRGTITNTGTITASSANLMLDSGNVILAGDGTIRLDSGYMEIYGPPSVLTNQGNTIRGTGLIDSTAIVNQGTIFADGGTLKVVAYTVTNSGTFQASNGGTLLVSEGFSSADFSGGTLQGGGTYVIDGTVHPSTLQINSLGTGGGEITTVGAGTTLVLNGPNPNVNFLDASGDNALAINTNEGSLYLEGGYSLNTGVNDYVQTAGLTQVDGTLIAPMVNIDGGILQGDGSVDANGGVNIAGGATIQAGNVPTPSDPPASPGTLNITGPLVLNTGSTVNETISGAALADISLLNVTGNVDTGTSEGVDVMLLNAFNPTASSTFIFLDYTGTLSAQTFFVTDPQIDPFGTFGIGYGTQDVYLTFTPTTSPVPEPATFLPLAILLGCLACGRRRKQAKQAAYADPN